MSEEITAHEFYDRVAALACGLGEGERRIVALAGPPASGKSTLAEAAVERLNGEAPGRAALLPMDGFHYDDEVLEPRGWRPRKGAPHTFDVGGLAATLQRLRLNEEPSVAAPRFDRSIEIARAGALLIEREVRVVLVEGNYLLLDDAPWPQLVPLFDVTAMFRVSEAELADRLRRRWEGFGLDEAAILAKLEENDLPNGRLVYARSRPADWTVTP